MDKRKMQQDSSILIVDDEPRNIQVLGNLLSKNNFHVEFATSGRSALEWVESNHFDLILLDIMMPGMTGFEVSRELKASPKTRDIPIIFLTARTETEDIVEGFKHGGADYVCKPFNFSELLRRIETHIELYQSRQKLARQNEIKNEILHVLSHDLVSSLGAITPMIDFLQENPEDSETFTAIIKSNVRNAMEVLDLTKQMLTADEKPIKVSRIRLARIFDRAKSVLTEKLKAKKIELKISVPDNLEVVAEEVSLQNSVILNLLTNAVKFSQRGSAITVEAGHEEADRVRVRICDQGVGMPRQLVEDLFDISKCTNRKGTEGEDGTGFGMPLAKKFMEKYGGEISVSSRAIEEAPEDHGTEVCLTFEGHAPTARKSNSSHVSMSDVYGIKEAENL